MELKDYIQEKMFSGDFDEAIKMLHEEIADEENEEKQREYFIMLIASFVESERLDEAEKAIEYFEKNFDADDEFYEAKGVYYLKRENYEKTMDNFIQGLNYNPFNASLHRNIAMMYKMSGEDEKYINHLSRSVELEPKTYLTQIAVAQANIEVGKLDDAKYILESILFSGEYFPSDKIDYIYYLLEQINDMY